MTRTAWVLFLTGACGAPEREPGDDTGETTETTPPSGPRLVPVPEVLTLSDGVFLLDDTTAIAATGDALATAELLAAALRPPTLLPFPVAAEGTITLTIDPSAGIPTEGYVLDVTTAGVSIVGGDEAGLFYGTQTLLQLLPPDVFAVSPQDETWSVPAVHIEDSPRFAWRGLMIDVARHFFQVRELERQIDLLAQHKGNRLHLHLTDDQGWRIEILGWPELTEIGGSTEVGGGMGGWYTQDEYAGLVAYAAARHVVIVPEIDLPGHAHAAVASVPELNESGVSPALYTGAGVISTPIWIDGPATAGFVADVFGEVAALTPGKWVHVGGDEAIDVAPADYADFLVGLQATLDSEGKVLIGWDEVAEADLDPPFVAQHWYSEEHALTAVGQGGQLISSPAEHAYLDMMQSPDATFGQFWAGIVDVEEAYDWDPVPAGLAETDVLGVEGALWTEFVATESELDFMVWPRLAAQLELAWSPEAEGRWPDFRDRLAWHGARLKAQGVNFYRSAAVPWVPAAH